MKWLWIEECAAAKFRLCFNLDRKDYSEPHGMFSLFDGSWLANAAHFLFLFACG